MSRERLTPTPAKGSAKGELKSRAKPWDKWDDSISDLTQYKASTEELIRRKEIHKSKHSLTRSKSEPSLTEFVALEDLMELHEKVTKRRGGAPVEEGEGNSCLASKTMLMVDILDVYEKRFNLIAKQLLLERKARIQLQEAVDKQELIVDRLIQEVLRINPNIVKS